MSFICKLFTLIDFNWLCLSLNWLYLSLFDLIDFVWAELILIDFNLLILITADNAERYLAGDEDVDLDVINNLFGTSNKPPYEIIEADNKVKKLYILSWL